MNRNTLILATIVVAAGQLAAVVTPNVVIIYSDDHGYTDLGIHGIDGNVDTPNMDALAKGGGLALPWPWVPQAGASVWQALGPGT
ncbi:MAG: hypothetical protein OEU26_02490 [Candidatus Tectomicrobia bacterium]|nr:hypothetical protein [Candidatus Tectomicrobia bacterium]